MSFPEAIPPAKIVSEQSTGRRGKDPRHFRKGFWQMHLVMPNADCDGLQSRGNCLDEAGLGTGFETAKHFFEFAPHLFDWVKVRGVGRQEEHRGANLLN